MSNNLFNVLNHIGNTRVIIPGGYSPLTSLQTSIIATMLSDGNHLIATRRQRGLNVAVLAAIKYMVRGEGLKVAVHLPLGGLEPFRSQMSNYDLNLDEVEVVSADHELPELFRDNDVVFLYDIYSSNSPRMKFKQLAGNNGKTKVIAVTTYCDEFDLDHLDLNAFHNANVNVLVNSHRG